MSWCIYKHTNKINGKVYIGQTNCKPEVRWRNGEGYAKQEYFYRAIQKYGWDGFTHDILEDNINTQELADERERYYIALYHSCVYASQCNGYNMTSGGGGKAKWTPKEEQILIDYYASHQESKIDLSNVLALLPNYTKDQIINKASIMGLSNNPRASWTFEEDEILIENYRSMGSNVSKLLPNRSISAILQRASAYGLSYEDESLWTKEEENIIITYFPEEGVVGVEQRLPHRSKKSIQGKACTMGITMKNPNQNRNGHGHRPVMLLEEGKIFLSIADAHRETGDDAGGICECCQGIRYSVHNRHYLYADDPRTINPKQAIIDIEKQKALNNPRCKPVRCKTTNEIFISAAEGKRKYSNASKIGECCRGNRKTSGTLPDGTKLEWEFWYGEVKYNDRNNDNGRVSISSTKGGRL